MKKPRSPPSAVEAKRSASTPTRMFCFWLPKFDDKPSLDRPLVPIPPADSRELIALALGPTKGREHQHAVAGEANSAVADRLLEYLQRSGIVLMRSPPAPPWSSNPEYNGRRRV